MAESKEKLAQSLKASETALWRLAMQGDEVILGLAAENPVAGPALLDRLYSLLKGFDLGESAARRVLRNGRADEWLVGRVLKDHPRAIHSEVELDVDYPEDSSLVVQLAKHPSTPQDALRALAASPYYLVREHVARRHGLPTTVYADLAKDDVITVRRNVAANVSVPAAILYGLAGDVDESVRLKVALNPSRRVRALKVLSRDQSMIVRLAAAVNR